ncbi:glycosyltransferase family 2 protein [Chloroflexota bacterium]
MPAKRLGLSVSDEGARLPLVVDNQGIRRYDNMTMKQKIIVAMPAYNEEKYIGSLVLNSRQYADEVIVVDDGSTDNTAGIAELAGASVVRHEGNRGYGSAIQSIFNEAKKRNADILVTIDADSQHNPEEIPALVKAISEGSEVVIGSREMQRNAIPTYRRIGQKVLSKLTYVVSRRKLSDTESGFRAYSQKAINELDLNEKGMAVSSEIVSTAARKGLKVTEVPVSVIYTKDSSTMNPVRHGVGVLTRIMVMISERRPLLFFGILGSISIVLGLVAGILVARTLFAIQVLNMGSALISMLLITVGVLCISTGIILDVLVRRLGNSS